MTQWFTCPVCGFQLAKIDTNENIKGIYVWCRKHKGEVEIVNNLKSQSQSQSRSMKIDLESQSQNQSQLVDT